MISQWQRLLKNSGVWVGSFTTLSPQGEVLEDTPSIVSLEPLNQGETMRQTIRKTPLGQPPQETVLEYRTLNQSTLFFDHGAFSQGSIQWAPFSEFGAELGLIAGQERLRLVQLFKRSELVQITLIREHLEGTVPPHRSTLTLDQLVGTWEGEATTIYPDWRPEETYPTRLEITKTGDAVHQVLTFGTGNAPIASTGQGSAGRVWFTGGSQDIQVLLLPGGVSSTCPIHIQPRQPIFLEVGWLLTPTVRQRMIRQYNAQGAWISVTWVAEERR